MKFKIRNSADGQFYFVLVASNGRTVACGETYHAKFKCLQTVKRINKKFILQVPVIDETVQVVKK